jgi:phage terminase small subunit
MPVKLTDKQELFCKCYIIHLNATKAAIQSGYSEKTAQEIGSQNLSKLLIQDRIAKLRKKTLEKLDISHERIAAEYAKLAFSDMSDVIGEDGEIKKMSDIKNSAAISSITVDAYTTKAGTSHNKTKMTLHSKRDGLDGLSKHTGFYEKDNKQKSIAQIVIEGSNAQEGVDNLPDPDK